MLISKGTVATLLVPIIILNAVNCLAQTDEQQVVENDNHHFAFAVMENSLVTYETDGNGFSGIYNSKGGGKGTHPDYGLLVYGVSSHLFSTKEAKAAGLKPPVEKRLRASSMTSQSEWQNAYSAQMQSHGREAGGVATVTSPDGTGFEVPYFTWSQSIGLKTAHALTYVVLHGDSFIHVQVESSSPLSAADLKWLTTQLALQEGSDED